VPDRVVLALAALVRDGRVLLVHRHPARLHAPDCWDLPGGHVEPGEDPADAVVRECREELDVRVLDPVPFALTGAADHLDVHAYVVTRWDGEPRNAAPDEHDDLRWLRPADLADLVLAHPGEALVLAAAVRSATPSSERPRRG
jgi:8-oxo-dGTP diphosphatase